MLKGKNMLIFVFFILVLSLSIVLATEGTEDTANWNKAFSSDGSKSDVAYSVTTDSNNNIYVVGYGFNLTGLSTNPDWWVKKFSSDGTEDTANWNKAFSSAGNYFDYAYSVAVDSNDNVYVGGFGTRIVPGSTNQDWWIKKFSSDGTEDTANWDKKITSGEGNTVDTAYSVAIDNSNNVYVAGYGYNMGVGSVTDWWIKKFSSDGTEDTANWNKNFTMSGEQSVRSITTDSNGNVYAVGYGTGLFNSSSGYDWWIKKFSSDGTEDTANWDKNFTSSGGGNDYAYSVAVDSSGNVYVVGYGYNLVSGSSVSDWWIKKFSSDGTEDTANWNKKISGAVGDDYAYSVAVDLNDNVYVVGAMRFAGSDWDWAIKKYSSDGTEDTSHWNKYLSSSGANSDYAYSVAVDYNNNVLVTGSGYNLVGSTGKDWWIKKFEGAAIQYPFVEPSWPAGYDLYDTSGNLISSSTAETTLQIRKNDVQVVEFDINASFDLSSVVVNTTGSKTVVSGLASATGVTETHSLYINGNSYSGVYVCPSALTLDDVNSTCTGNVSVLCPGSAGGYTCTVEGDLFKVSGLTGSGAGGEGSSADVPEFGIFTLILAFLVGLLVVNVVRRKNKD